MPAKPKEWIFDYAMCGGHNGSHYLVHPLNKSWFPTKDCTKEQLAAICAHHYVSIPPNAVFKDYAEALETRAMDRYKTMNLEPIKNALRSRRLPYSGLNKPGLQERLLNDIAEHKYDGWETYHLMKEVEKRGGTDPTGMTADELKEWLKQNDWAIAQAQGPKGTPGSPISAPESPDTQRWNSRNRIISSWDPEELRRQRKEMRIDYLGRNRKLLEALIMGYMVDKGELRKRPDSANLTKRLREVLEDSELEQLSDTGLKILLKYAGVLAWNLDKPRDVLLLMSRNDGRWVLSTYTPNFDAEGSSDDDHESEPNAIEPVPEAEGLYGNTRRTTKPLQF